MRRILILLVLLAVAAAACGGSAESTTTTEAPEVTTTVSSTAAPGTTQPPDTTDAPDPGRTPANGDTVGVFYTGTLDDGEQFDSNVGGSPLTFVVGSGQVISGFDDAVRGLMIGESVTVRLEPAEAYGEKDDALIIEVPSEGAPEGLAVGDEVGYGGQRVTILEIREDVIVIDANPSLAGEALTFTIELVSIS